MSLNTFDYINKLLLVAAESLNIQYTKETPTTLNLFCSENEGAFIANLSSKINQSLDNVSFAVSLYFVVSRDYDITEEDKLKQESEARTLASQFIYLLKNNKYCSVQNDGFDLIFREGGYLGMGIAGTVTISLPDKDDNCDLFCNTSTIDVEC